MQLTSLQAHLRSVHVKEGQVLRKGDTIGVEGSTGISSGSHVHHSIIKGKRDTTWRQSEAKSLGGTEQMLKDWLAAGAYKDGKQPRISTPWGWYTNPWGKRVNHEALDYVGVSAKTLVWPYDQPGTITKAHVGDGNNDYGHYVLITWNSSDSAGTGSAINKTELKKGDKMKNIKFTMQTNVRSKPSTSGQIVATYNKGEVLKSATFHGQADGHLWLTYVSNSGETRYIAYAKTWITHQ